MRSVGRAGCPRQKLAGSGPQLPDGQLAQCWHSGHAGCWGTSQELIMLRKKLKDLLLVYPHYMERIFCLQLHEGIKFYMKGLNSCKE